MIFRAVSQQQRPSSSAYRLRPARRSAVRGHRPLVGLTLGSSISGQLLWRAASACGHQLRIWTSRCGDLATTGYFFRQQMLGDVVLVLARC